MPTSLCSRRNDAGRGNLQGGRVLSPLLRTLVVRSVEEESGKGALLAARRFAPDPSSCGRMHRPTLRSEIGSTHRSRNLATDSEKVAAKPRICFGLTTETPNGICFESEGVQPLQVAHDASKRFYGVMRRMLMGNDPG